MPFINAEAKINDNANVFPALALPISSEKLPNVPNVCGTPSIIISMQIGGTGIISFTFIRQLFNKVL